MSHRLLIPFLLLFAALTACAFPPSRGTAPAVAPPPSPAIDQVAALEILQRALPARALVAAGAVTLAPQPAQVLADGQLAVTVVGHLATQKARDGGWLACIPHAGATVTAIVSSGGPASSALNVPGPNTADLHGRSVTLPLIVRPGDKLIVLSGTGGTPSPRPALGNAVAGGEVDEAMAISFVAYDVRKEVVGELLRGPAWGRRSPLVDFLANNPWPVAAIDWSRRLPERFPLAQLRQAGAQLPDVAATLAMHEHFACDVFSDWRCAGRVPYTAHQGYGTFYLGRSGEAMILALSDLPLEQRKAFALSIAQRAIDTFGGHCDEALRYRNGGHCRGRRAELVLLGHLFDFEPFGNPTPFLGEREPEDQQQVVVPWWQPQDGSVQPWWVGYHFSNGTRANLWSTPPSTWGDRHDPTHRSDAWQVCYGAQVNTALLAQAAAIVAMGRETWAPKLVQAARCWHDGPPAAARSQLEERGIVLDFGRDYAVAQGFAVAAWRHVTAASSIVMQGGPQ